MQNKAFSNKLVFNNQESNFDSSANINEISSNNKVRQVQPSSDFFNIRNPSLNVGLSPGIIRNNTILPNQLKNSLDLLAQTEQLTISNMNKNSNILDNSHIISSNELNETFDNFQGVSVPYTPYDDYNKPQSYFNNFNGSGRTDIIKEYICHVNSIDRDIKQYPNPFKFFVKFAPLAGDKDASISRTFSNIRYLKIETAVLPRRYYVSKEKSDNNDEIVKLFNKYISDKSLPLDNKIIATTEKLVIIYARFDKDNNKVIINYTKYDSDISKPVTECYEAILKISDNNYNDDITTYKYTLTSITIEHDKYTLIYINDINDVSNFSTDDVLSKAFNVMFPDIIYGDNLYVDCRYADKIYKYTELGNMKNMRLTLTDSTGKELTVNIKALDFNVSTINSVNCSCREDSNGNLIRDYKCICNYIRHPRYLKNQIDIMFKFGIVETDFDKRAFN